MMSNKIFMILAIYVMVFLNPLKSLYNYNILSRFKYSSKLFVDMKENAISTEKNYDYDFEKMLLECKRTGIYTPAVVAAERWLSSGNYLTYGGLISVIKIFGLANLIDDAKRVLELAYKRGVKVNVCHYNAVINVCRLHKKNDDALELFDELKSKGLTPDIITISSIISVLGAKRDYAQLMKLYESSKNLNRDSIFYNNVLVSLSKCNRYEECIPVYMQMLEDGITPSHFTYNTMLSIMDRLNDHDKALEIFNHLIDNGIAPDKVIIFSIIRILEGAKRFDEASAIKRKYPGHHSPAVAATTADEVGMATSNGDTNRKPGSSTPLKASHQDEDKITEYAFGDLLHWAKRSGDFREAVNKADKWFAKEDRLTFGGITACLNIYGHAGLVDKAEGILKLLELRGIGYNAKHYNAVMSAYSRCGQYEKAIKMFEEMDSKVPRVANPLTSRDTYSYGIALAAKQKLGEFDRGVEIYNEMDKLQVPKSLVIFNTMINFYGKAGQWEKAVEMFEDIARNNMEPDKVAIFAIIHALERSEKWELVNRYCSMYSKYRPKSFQESNAGTLGDKLLKQSGSSVIRLLGEVGDIDKAVGVLVKLEAEGIPLKDIHFNAALTACHKSRDVSKAMALYRQMIDKAVSRNSDTYKILTKFINDFSAQMKTEDIVTINKYRKLDLSGISSK